MVRSASIAPTAARIGILSRASQWLGDGTTADPVVPGKYPATHVTELLFVNNQATASPLQTCIDLLHYESGSSANT